MKELIGQIKAELIEDEPISLDILVEKINANIRPPEPVTSGDVYIRAMYLISDQVNSYGGRFPADEHGQLIELLVDSPVMVGHRKDQLPIARNFFAEMVQKDGINWVKVYFYWLKDAAKGEDLRRNIDGGIYKEGSISFLFNFPECSVCGADIRDCRHRPFAEYNINGQKVKTHFNYRQIVKVLETSLVYRGSVNDTAITRELIFGPILMEDIKQETKPSSLPPIHFINDLSLLSSENKFFVMPAYESLPVQIEKSSDKIASFDVSGIELKSAVLKRFLSSLPWPDGDYLLTGRLIGYRGKERQKIADLVKFLSEDKSNVRRLELKVIDIQREGTFSQRRCDLEKLLATNKNLLINGEEIAGENLTAAVNSWSTRYGVEIHDHASGCWYHYSARNLLPLELYRDEGHRSGFKYNLHVITGGDNDPIETVWISAQKLSPGETVEMETAGLRKIGDKYGLIQPRFFDHYPAGLKKAKAMLSATEKKVEGGYCLYRFDDKAVLLVFDDDRPLTGYKIERFSTRLLNRGRRFLVEKIHDDVPETLRSIGQGKILQINSYKSAIVFEAVGSLTGRLIIRPIRLNGIARLMLQKAGQADE